MYDIRDGARATFYPSPTAASNVIPAAGTVLSQVLDKIAGAKYILAIMKFVRTSGGTTIDAYLQTSPDGGTTWTDIAQWSVATTTATKMHAVHMFTALAANQAVQDAALSANTILNGLIGDRLRVKFVIVGTYTGTIQIDVVVK